MLTAFGLMAARVAIVHQGIQIGVSHGEHMPAAPPVTTIGAAELLVFFVPERHAAIATITSGNVNKGFIDELHGVSSLQKGPQYPLAIHCGGMATRTPAATHQQHTRNAYRPNNKAPAKRGFDGCQRENPQAGVTLTVDLDNAPLVPNDTWPSTKANKV